MNATTLRYIEQAIEDNEPESPLFTIECRGVIEYNGSINHYYCDATKCIEAAMERAYEDMLYSNDVECETCGGNCEL